MASIFSDLFSGYWSPQEITVNLVVFINLLGALLLGLIVGYERSYHGRAAGMRTYGLVCMASCALVVIIGYPAFWYGNSGLVQFGALPPTDPTRVIQGIVTGIGFLGAGVIMKEGLSISGLTTAASIWSSSAIGVLVGIGFYSAAILLTLLSATLMMWASRIENWLPSRPAIAVTLRFRAGYMPQEAVLERVARERGYDIARGTIQIHATGNTQEWRFVAIAIDRHLGAPLTTLSAELSGFEGVEEFHLVHARN